MKRSIKHSQIEGEIFAPPSKSLMQRMTAAALLTEGTTTEIRNPSFSADCLASLDVVKKLGAEVSRYKNRVVIKGGLSPSVRELSCGESGLCMRMFAPIASLCPDELTLNGEGSLRSRPMDMLVMPLKDLSVRCTTHNGHQPITVHGPLKGGRAEVDGSISSQFLTGLLMALPRAEGDSEIHVENLTSRPYIDLTLKVLESCGIHIPHDNYARFSIKGNQTYHPRGFTVEGDWSGAAFLLVAAAVGGDLALKGLDVQSPQPDRKILEVLKDCGASVRLTRDVVVVQKRELRAFDFDITDSPDLVPPLAVLACSCLGTSRLRGTDRLQYKESDRTSALQQELSRMGIVLRIIDGNMEIQGGDIHGGVAQSHADHRIAMAMAVLAINATQPITVEGTECVNKSYPAFFEDLASIGGKVDE
ncbi:MAG TPA: 3-phosphoshikimate 1-carboxyvinyltransferase [Candidatus Heimdallarchaeota archaeon]|nr:3-phosphoshikimate 1-carboxyvinyltransferase [Candidatus Heimdallarchaeota archaeon]